MSERVQHCRACAGDYVSPTKDERGRTIFVPCPGVPLPPAVQGLGYVSGCPVCNTPLFMPREIEAVIEAALAISKAFPPITFHPASQFRATGITEVECPAHFGPAEAMLSAGLVATLRLALGRLDLPEDEQALSPTPPEAQP